MIEENQQLVTNELAEFENNRLKLKTSGGLSITLEEFVRYTPNYFIIKKLRVDLQAPGSQLIMLKNLPQSVLHFFTLINKSRKDCVLLWWTQCVRSLPEKHDCIFLSSYRVKDQGDSLMK